MKEFSRVSLYIGFMLLLAISSCNEYRPLDSEGSYFPHAKGYEWNYERHHFGRLVKESYDTFSIRVSSSDSLTNGWTSYQLTGGAFEDVGNEVLIRDERVIVFEGSDTISIFPPDSNGDTLHLYLSTGYFPPETYQYVDRITGVGVVCQGYEEYTGHRIETGYSDRLLSFQKGDTIWRF